MDPKKAGVEVSRILGSTLDELTDGGQAGVVPVVDRDSWDLPGADKGALWCYGLPRSRSDGLMGVMGDFQTSHEPELAGGGELVFFIGMFGAARLAATRGSGLVIGIPACRYVHPQLQHLHPEGISSMVVNSTVAKLVDLAWRWHWLVPILADQQMRASTEAAGDAEVFQATGMLPDAFADVRALCRDVLDRFRSIDSEAITGEDSFWGETVMEDL